MAIDDDLARLIKRELSRHQYSARTKSVYESWLNRLFARYPDTPPEEISLAQIGDYISFLQERRHLAPQTLHQARCAFVFFFENVLSKDYDVKSISLPKKKRRVPEILTDEEVLKLLDHTEKLKYKLMLALMYSAGLEISQVVELRITDVDLENRLLHIQHTRKRFSRNAPLAESIVRELECYIDLHRPSKWLFEGRKKGMHCSTSSVQRAFSRARRSAGIAKSVSSRSLRYSYVKHLEAQGVPLQGVPLHGVLQHLGILTDQSLRFFTGIDAEDVIIDHSPLDRITARDVTWSSTRTGLERVTFLCERFPLFARQLNKRERGRSPVKVDDEYDLQYLLCAIFKLHFDDVRPEEWTPSYAGGASRVDFLLKEENIVVEAKRTRDSLADNEVGSQLLVDIARYTSHPDCKTLVCFVYDPEHRIENPSGLTADLSKQSTESLRVVVLVKPS